MTKLYLIKYTTLILPFIGLAFFLYLNKSQKSKILQISFLLAVLLFSWVRFVEPNIILTKEHKISNINEKRVALIADLHLGVYKDDSFLKRVTTKINQIPNLDAVLIAGDFTFYPTKNQNLNDLFSPLSELQVPVIAVLGNHDVQKPGPDLRNELVLALKANDVQIINNQILQIDELNIIGLGDHWAKEDEVSLISTLETNDKAIILTHNPDTVYYYPESTNFLTVTGHTHGGQIRIPYLYKKVIPTENTFDKGIHQTPKGPVFVTSGLGEVDLPIRFLVPPTIDILNL